MRHDASEVGKTIFFEDNRSFRHSAPMPASVFDALLATEQAVYARDQRAQNQKWGPKEFFRSAVVHLSGTDEADYVVNGLFPLAGIGCAWFWIVLPERGHARVVLFDSTGYLRILESKSNGYRDIETVFTSAAGFSDHHIFQFDGHEYKLARDFETAENQSQ
jgi:hypothetical protein